MPAAGAVLVPHPVRIHGSLPPQRSSSGSGLAAKPHSSFQPAQNGGAAIAPQMYPVSAMGLFRLLVPLFFLALALASGKLPAFVILSMPILLFFATFIEGSDASLVEIIDAFTHGAFIAPPILFALEFTLAVALAFCIFGVEGTYGIVSAMESSPAEVEAEMQQPSLHVPTIDALADRLLAAMTRRHDRLLFITTFSFFVASLAEEGLKLFMAVSLSKFPLHSQARSLLSIRKLVWTCGAVGLGLSFGESVVAVTGMRGSGAARGALERVVSDVPTHTACAVLSGARLASGRTVVSALAPSFAVHGLFDLCVLSLASVGAPQWISLVAQIVCASAVSYVAGTRVAALERGERLVTEV